MSDRREDPSPPAWRYKISTEIAAENIKRIVFSPSGKFLASGDGAGRVCIHTLSGQVSRTFENPKSGAISSICWISEGTTKESKSLLSGHSSGTLSWVSNLLCSRGQFSGLTSVQLPMKGSIRRLRGHSEPVSFIAQHPIKLQRFATAGSKTITIWHLSAGNRFTIRSIVSYSLRLSADGLQPLMSIIDTPNWRIEGELIIRHLTWSGSQIFTVYRNHGFAYLSLLPIRYMCI